MTIMTAKEFENLADQYARRDFETYDLLDADRGTLNARQRAIYYYEQALALNENNARLWSKLANQHSYSQALVHIEKALNLEPDNSLFQTQKADFLIHEDRLEEALTCINEALTISPSYLKAQVIKAKLLKSQSDSILDHIEVESSVPELLFAASTCFQNDRMQEGLRYLDKAIKLEPENKYLWTTKYWYLHAAYCYHEAESIPIEKLSFRYSISLKTFFQTGHFGPITLGMTKQQVLDVLGNPEGVWGYEDNELESTGLITNLYSPARPYWRYGDIDFFFNDDAILCKMSSARLYLWRYSFSRVIKLDPWVFKGVHGFDDVLQLHELLEALRQEGINYEDKGFGSFIPKHLDSGKVLVSSGVEVIYEKEHGATIVSVLSIY